MKLQTNLKIKNINMAVAQSKKEGGLMAKQKVEKIKFVEDAPEVEKIPAVVSFRMVSKIKLCFRECASIVKVASDTACFVEIASGTKEGNSDSILSLVNLAVTAGQSLLLKIHGDNNKEASAANLKLKKN